MATNDQYFSLVKTSRSSWVAVRVNTEKPPVESQTHIGDTASSSQIEQEKATNELFSSTASDEEALIERYPRLAIAVVALVIFAMSVTAEIEYLRQAGFTWH